MIENNLNQKENMKNTEIFLVRHGETFAKTNDNELGVPFVCGSGAEISRNTHLTPQGKQQMFDLGKSFIGENFDVVVVSNLIRSRESAEEFLKGLGQSDLINNLIVDERVTEINYGENDGASEEIVKQRKKDFFDKNPEIQKSSIPHTFPGQESFEDASKRIGEFIKDISQKYPGKKVLVFSHSGAMRAFAGNVQFGKDLKFGEVIKLKSDGESLSIVD